MSDEAILEAQIDFSLQLLRELNLNSDISSVVSPISVILALSLAYAGAEKETRDEFEDVFSKGRTKEEFHKSFQELNKFLNATDKSYTLETANKVYFDSNFTIKDAYKEVISQFYNGNFESLDFKSPTEVANEVNKFVELKTHEKIKDLISADGISSDTKMILINAIYYKGSWKNKFDKNLTNDKDFHIKENSKKQVKMMKKSDFNVIYQEADGYQVLGLPYEDDEIFLYVILPTEKFGLDNVLKELKTDKLKKLLSQRYKNKVDVELPVFKITTNANLKGTLIKLGFKQGFTNGANFKGINENEPLKIDEVVHKAFIETNEEGSEAAAATGITMRLLSASIEPEKPVFIADHPFLFVLIGKDSQILFIGTVRDFE